MLFALFCCAVLLVVCLVCVCVWGVGVCLLCVCVFFDSVLCVRVFVVVVAFSLSQATHKEIIVILAATSCCVCIPGLAFDGKQIRNSSKWVCLF